MNLEQLNIEKVGLENRLQVLIKENLDSKGVVNVIKDLTDLDGNKINFEYEINENSRPI